MKRRITRAMTDEASMVPGPRPLNEEIVRAHAALDRHYVPAGHLADRIERMAGALELIVEAAGNIPEVAKRVAEIRDEQTRQRAERLEMALREIREEQGRVCDEFELCDHRACQSSYTSWAIADSVLNPEGVK